MESIWTVPWNPYGIVHGFPLEIHWKFHGIHSGYGIEKWLAYQQKKILWNPPIPYDAFPNMERPPFSNEKLLSGSRTKF